MDTSRLIVKNLPKTLTDAQLRKQFSDKGTITDCQLKYTHEGIFRKFAFVGYRTSTEAQIAIDHFNNTYIGQSKIQVEVCQALGSNNKPRAWSKYAKDSSAHQRLNPSSPKSTRSTQGGRMPEATDKVHKSEEISEFSDIACPLILKPNVEVLHSGRNVTKEKDTKDTAEPAPGVPKVTPLSPDDIQRWRNRYMAFLSDETKNGSVALNNSSEWNDMKRCAVVIAGLPKTVKPKALTMFLAPIKPKTVRIAVDPTDDEHAIACVRCMKTQDKKRVLKHNDTYFGGSRMSIVYFGKLQEEQSLTAAAPMCESEVAKLEADQTLKEDVTRRKFVDQISETGRLFVRNLSFQCSEDDLEKLFEPYGPLADTSFIIDPQTKMPKGYAMLTFVFSDKAVLAFTDLDGIIFQGRVLHILPGKETVKKYGGESNPENSSFKRKKFDDLRAKSSGIIHAWNSLFLGASSVADATANRLDISKRDILDPSTDQSVGVRMALGETQIVRETREFLIEHGVSLDSFSNADGPRSKTTFLLKNLPAKSTADEISKLCGRFGQIVRVVLPPSGATALVEFAVSQEAKRAFEELSYAKFKNAPLYLEKAPIDVFENEKSNSTETVVTEKAEETEEESDMVAESGATLFVKNLNFDTTDSNLRDCFALVGPLLSARVTKKKSPKTNGLLSMGYGFVQYFRKNDAESALKRLQHVSLDGHQLELKRSEMESKSVSEKPEERSKSGDLTFDRAVEDQATKLMVRNIPFQANEKEIRELFKTFGELKTVRLPQKPSSFNQKSKGGEHRGFAFVDYVTHTSAVLGFKALCHSTHLYGRRLVIEWAQPEETIEDIRKRTNEHFHRDEPNRAKKGKSNVKNRLTDSGEKINA